MKMPWLLALCTLCAPTARAQPAFADMRLVDLTHVLDASFPFIPVPGVTYPFALHPIATLDEHGVAANAWRVHEHLGTQIDAPNHFVRGGRALHELHTEELFAPLVVLDVRRQAQRDPDFAISVSDVKAWEARHGRIPRRALVAMYAGWDLRITDSARYLQPDAAGTLHFPGFSAEVATFLARERDVWGLGVDTISFDPGRDRDYRAHKALLQEDRLALEALANLQHVPERGAFVFIGAPNVRDATGGPARVVALVPRNAHTLTERDRERLLAGVEGRWKSAQPEPSASGLLVRELELQGDRWALRFTLFTSHGRASLRGQNRGRFRVVAGTQADGALWAEFRFETRTLTPLDAERAAALVQAGCAAQVVPGQRVDVRNGCQAFRVYAPCEAEYDRIALVAGELHLGARPADGNLCAPERRPEVLGAPLVRQK